MSIPGCVHELMDMGDLLVWTKVFLSFSFFFSLFFFFIFFALFFSPFLSFPLALYLIFVKILDCVYLKDRIFFKTIGMIKKLSLVMHAICKLPRFSLQDRGNGEKKRNMVLKVF